MGCESCVENTRMRIVKGEDAEILFNVRYDNGSFFDLSGKTLSAKFRNQDGTTLTLTGAAVVALAPEANGKGKITLTDAQTAALLESEAGDFDLIITEGADVKIVPFRRVLLVLAPIS